jgi:alkylation response protein AidB-like acyl-CoA dehydrogenase
MPNYFSDNPDLVFHFSQLDNKEAIAISENDYGYSSEYAHAPTNYEDAQENYRRVLELVGDISGNFIAERAAAIDVEGCTLTNGKVSYAKGTKEDLAELAKADLMGLILPYRFGGLNIPFSVYVMAIEMASRADATMMNLFGLQDIADCINKFGNEDQRQRYMPPFATGQYTGAMVLTEPDAGSDLQAVKLMAYQNEQGEWRLRGSKRFITNGCGDVLLVLARSEAGTKDARGLSMFVCRGDETVVIRRIEHKLGINGSPTCEMQFNDTPAELVGKRRMGLIKYTLDLMYRARMGTSAQAVGISQQAYEEALKYAKEREQFGKPIYEIPVVTNLLVDMRVALEADRTLLCRTSYYVELKEKLDEQIDRLKEQGKSTTDLTVRLREVQKIAGLLTPLCKYFTTESSNKITYDALQIHGGTGYMKEFKVERLARDARITNIYEGTSQLQVVAALGGVVTDVLKDFFEEHEKKEYRGALATLAAHLKEMRALSQETLRYVTERRDSAFQDVAAKHLVDLYGTTYVGYLLMDHAEILDRKVFIANRYVLNAVAEARKHVESIKNGALSDLLHADKILI